jgi:dihydroneopterin aldolase
MNEHDTIQIKGLTVHGAHGCYEYEQKGQQRFVVDVTVVPMKQFVGADEIAATVNYEDLRRIVTEVLYLPPVHLMESLVEMIASRVLLETGSKKVQVTMSKPDIFPDCVPSVTITRVKR